MDQAGSLESFYNEFPSQDVAIILVNFADENWSSSEESLKTFTCGEVGTYNYTFVYYAIDPGSNPFTDKYRAFTLPANLVLDDDMVIRYKMGIYDTDGLRDIFNTLLGE
jgi:hypothetical protein